MTEKRSIGRRAAEIFDLVIEIEEPTEREARLAAECREDARLRAYVDALLSAERYTDGFFSRPAVDALRGTDLSLEPQLELASPGDEFGPYRIVESIGVGGMSQVFAAESGNPEIGHQIALKILYPAPGLAYPSRSFDVETHALTQLDHPSIVRLHDGGTSQSGLRFLAMELVSGLPIDQHCRERELPIREVLRLFSKVCGAVQFAHERLIVHRDLKPSNIFVTEDGVPKLLDFGIAKLLDPVEHRGEQTVGVGRALTPNYASPEQLEGGIVTTASDVFSLGVVLFELMTGTRPFERRRNEPSDSDLLRNFRAQPPRPSERVLTAATSRVHGPGAARQLVGDLDAILATALQPDAGRRYQSVAAFAEDIERHLEGLPVKAREPRFLYRSGRFLRRHLVSVAVAATLLVVVLTSAIVSTVQARRLAVERDRALVAQQEAELQEELAAEVTRFLTDSFEHASPSRQGASATVLEALRGAVTRARNELDSRPDLRATVFHIVGRVYADLGYFDDSAPLLDEALELRRELYGPDHELVGETLSRISQMTSTRSGDHGEAFRLGSEAVTILRRNAGQTSMLADALSDFAVTAVLIGEYELAIESSVEALEIHRHLGSDRSFGAGVLHQRLANAHWKLGKVVEARGFLEAALSIHLESGRTEFLELASIHIGLGKMELWVGRYAEATQQYLDALTLIDSQQPDHPTRGTILSNLGESLNLQGRAGEAVVRLREAVAFKQDAFGPRARTTVISRAKLALPLAAEGAREEAIDLLKSALIDLGQSASGDDRLMEFCHRHLGLLLLDLGRLDAAEAALSEAASLSPRVYGEDHPDRALATLAQAQLEQNRGNFDDARRLAEHGLAHQQRLLGAEHPLVLDSLELLDQLPDQ